mmetsp:Transcript_57978/g.188637  ORF Transcript_57978/g.188637 Transcript_57978/m.188637 type:complete len:266 (-) Transcript_57978:165-962(-)
MCQQTQHDPSSLLKLCVLVVERNQASSQDDLVVEGSLVRAAQPLDDVLRSTPSQNLSQPLVHAGLELAQGGQVLLQGLPRRPRLQPHDQLLHEALRQPREEAPVQQTDPRRQQGCQLAWRIGDIQLQVLPAEHQLLETARHLRVCQQAVRHEGVQQEDHGLACVVAAVHGGAKQQRRELVVEGGAAEERNGGDHVAAIPRQEILLGELAGVPPELRELQLRRLGGVPACRAGHGASHQPRVVQRGRPWRDLAMELTALCTAFLRA